jgi:hypothetical protein
MKTILIFALSTLVVAFAAAQNPNIDEVKVTAPMFAGVENALQVQNQSSSAFVRNYLMQNINCPEKAQYCKMQGTEVVQFTVTASGNVTDLKIINSVCPEIDAEITRVLKGTSGMWLPGYNNGKPVDMTKEVSLAFYINDLSKKPAEQIFKEKATSSFNAGNKALFEKGNIKKALRLYSTGVNYMPYDNSLLLVRGMCRYEMGDHEGAKMDWSRMTGVGMPDMTEYASILEEMKGYNEMMATIVK